MLRSDAALPASPIRLDLAYAAFNIGGAVTWSVVSGWLLYFYVPPEGLPRAPVVLYGAAMLILHTVNAALAPAIGYISDNARGRWGRRLPFMAASALPLLIFFALLWTPPVSGESIWNLLYLSLVLELYYLAYGLNQIPYAALLPELALTDAHRVRLSAFSAGSFLIGIVLGGFAGLLIARVGYAGMGLIYALLLLPVFYGPLLFLRERPGRQIAPAARLGIRASLRVMLQNKAFLVLVAAGVCYWAATASVTAIVPFVVTEICLLPTADSLYFFISAVLASLVCYPIVTRFALRWGKWPVFSGSLVCAALAVPSLLLIGPWFPVPLMAQGIFWISLQAVALSGVLALPQAFAAEITDEDEKMTGQRREATYFAAWGTLDQLVKGGAAAALPVLLLFGRSQADPNGPLGVRLIALLAGGLLFIAFIIFLRYPLRYRPVTA